MGDLFAQLTAALVAAGGGLYAMRIFAQVVNRAD